MQRKTTLVAGLGLLLLAACGRSGNYAAPPMAAMIAAERAPGGEQFSFTNYWSIAMQRGSIEPRFERTRTACLTDASLNCKLVSANIEVATGSPGASSSASLEVQLPHDRIDGFKKSLLAPVGNEKAEEASLISSSTRAENVSGESANAARKVQQLTGYRDRLAALAKRPNLSVEDTIKLEAEISRVQGELDAAIGIQASADNRVARETVSISLGERRSGAIPAVWNRGLDILAENVASALEFLIGAIPWLPIVAAGTLLVTWLVRLMWRRKQAVG
jgi:hypothetical protein